MHLQPVARISVPLTISLVLILLTGNRSHSGVISSRLRASEKNANTSSSGRATHCSPRNVVKETKLSK